MAGVVTVATWNIHGGVGGDGRYVPARIAHVLQEIGADVIALQEVGSRKANRDLLDHLQHHTGYEAVAGPTLSRGNGEFGNALLSRFPIQSVLRVDLAVHGREPRGALDVRVDAHGTPLRIVATHLGLLPGERRQQVRRIIAAVEAGDPVATVLMGDVNEWYLWGRPLRWLHAHFRAAPAPRTFPARRPMFALDRIWMEPNSCLKRISTHVSPLSRIASDHLPVKAVIELASATIAEGQSAPHRVVR